MQKHIAEQNRLDKAKEIVESKYSSLGINKKREIVRLLYEISKREGINPDQIIKDDELKGFQNLKECLLKKRFPLSIKFNSSPDKYFLPEISFNPDQRFCHCPTRSGNLDLFEPKKIYVEKGVVDTTLFKRFKNKFPHADIDEISSLKEYLKHNKKNIEKNYNKRCDIIFIVDEKFDFFKTCPCTNKAVPCGYHIQNLGFGCIYECSYCFLQGYSNTPGLIFPAKLDTFFDQFNGYKNLKKTKAWQIGDKLRIGTGEFCDSLMLDHITEYSLSLIDFYKNKNDVVFELKTKSANIDNVIKADHTGNIVIGWSLNPENIVNENELYTASLAQRLDAAKQCVDAGYKVAFHFDPIFFFNEWEKEYELVIDTLLSKIKTDKIAWISLGTLRFNPDLKRIIENRFPENKILDSELIKGFDDKLRYPYKLRFEVYNKMLSFFNQRAKNLPIYLCMEDKKMWRDLGLKMPF